MQYLEKIVRRFTVPSFGLSAALLLSLNAVTANIAAEQDDYLKAIQQEVQGLDQSDASSPAPTSTSAPVNSPLPATASVPYVPYKSVRSSATKGGVESPSQFEQTLRSAYPGSYFLMRKLPGEERKAVYQEFLDSGDLARVRQMIVELARSHR